MKTASKNKSFAQGPTISFKHLIDLRYCISDIDLFNKNIARSQMSSGHRSNIRGRGMDFDEVRLYQPGDDVRNIDWRVTARTMSTHTKIYREEKDRPILLIIDQRSSMQFGTDTTYKSCMAAQLASLIAWSGLNDNDKVGGIVFNDNHYLEVTPKRNKNSVLTLLKHIAAMNHLGINKENNSNATSDHVAAGTLLTLEAILENTRRITKPGSAVFILSDFHDWNEECKKRLHLIKRHNDLYAISIHDQMEETLPAFAQLTVTNGREKLPISTNQAVIDEYRKRYQQQRQVLYQDLDKLGLSYQEVKTGDQPRQSLLQLVRGRNPGHHRRSA